MRTFRRPFAVATVGQESSKLNRLVNENPALAKEMIDSLAQGRFLSRDLRRPPMDQVNFWEVVIFYCIREGRSQTSYLIFKSLVPEG